MTYLLTRLGRFVRKHGPRPGFGEVTDSLVTLLMNEGEKTRWSTRLGKCPSWKRDIRMLTVASGELRAFSSSTISSLEKN